MTESDVAQVVDALIAAGKSEDPQRLPIAVRQAAVEIEQFSINSSLERELQELLLGIVENLSYLASGEAADQGHGRRREVCFSLLRHAKAVAAMTINPKH